MRKLLWLFMLLFVLPVYAQDDVVTITIINTSDEHGWMQSFTPFGSDEVQGGAANIYSWWELTENTLLLSGGDNWTGPAISTWFEGEPMIELFNAMGYDASAIGNHEFDFGRDVMEQRFSEAAYPYLAANIRYAETGELLAQPYILLESSGVTVGVIGLTTLSTETTTHPRNISDLEFVDYVSALEEFVPQMQAEGAQIIIGLTHACSSELSSAAQSGLVDVLFTGHCNELINRTVNDVPIIGGGSSWHSYAQLTITYNTAIDEIEALEPELIDVVYTGENPVTPDETISEIVDRWQTAVDEQLSEEIGYTDVAIEQRSASQANLITDAWLWAYPTADIAITNTGGMRQTLDAGILTWGDIVGVLPFDNELIAIELTGQQVIDNLRCCGGAIAGITYVDGSFVLNDGSALQADEIYTVLVNDFMYCGGDGYLFESQNPDGYNTNIHWRQPVIDYILSLETSEENPLSNHLDATERLR